MGATTRSVPPEGNRGLELGVGFGEGRFVQAAARATTTIAAVTARRVDPLIPP